MLGQWISNLLARSEQFSQLRLAEMCTSVSELRRRYGRGRWRKLKGIARVRLIDGTVHTAEVHWYEAHGIGRRELKIKFPLLD